jgi:Heterokaryon incompatibility protein (HET)
MESIRNTFTYQPSQSEKGKIRLLKLFPGQRSDDVVLSLFHVFLVDNPTYEALLYIGGDPEVIVPVQLEACRESQVTINLEHAPRDLRFADRTRMLWVDAVCIYQKNVTERNKQDKMMRTSYRRLLT